LEEYELTQHYQQWKHDLDLAAETGVKYLRWGIPWYRVQPAPDQWDWAWVDDALEYLVNIKGITPILDLMHYGTPLWLANSFINSSYPQRVAEYTAKVVERYRSIVKYYTPLNEPMVNADMSGNKAEWPPYLSGDDGYVKMTLALAKGILLTTRALKAEQPEAITVQVEALWHTFTEDEALRSRAEFDNYRQYLCFDLVTGRLQGEHPLLTYLCEHGVTESELSWFSQNAVSFDILGANFYPWSYGELVKQEDGSIRHVIAPSDGRSIAIVIQEAYERYQMPIMVTETSANTDIPGRAKWMDETLDAVRTLRTNGIPVIGYTWFPLFTMVDWAYRTGDRPVNDYLIHLGLYDSAFDSNGILVRNKTSLVQHFHEHMTRSMPSVALS
jgi:beta-glucosidase/6-phospho-beta-glucosidase/beta-galactosidase